MGVVATIENVTLVVDPGDQVSSDVRVRNTGMVVDRVVLEVLGDAAGWAEIEPPQLNLLPGTDATARVTFKPPRSSEVLAGDVDYAVRARSQEDPDGSVVEEGSVTVTEFSELTAELEPRTARGSRTAKFRLVVSNLGNHPVTTEVSALDPDLLLNFRINPPTIVSQPGTSTFVKIRSAPRKRFVRGPDVSLPFQAFVLPETEAPVTADGAMLQQQIMPKWLLPAIAAVIAAAAVLVALWFLVLKPTVQSTAVQAVAQQTQQLASSASEANKAATKANQAAAGANSAAGNPAGGSGSGAGAGADGAGSKAGSGSAAGGSAAGGAGGAGAGGAAGGAAAGTPVSDQLAANAAPTTTAMFATYPYALPAGQQTLNVSDLVLQNPMGDTGILQIRSGGKALLEFGLADFRSLDLHFVQPLVFTTKAPLVLAVECLNTNATNCTAAVSFSGSTQK
ncbi:MAG TPA: hypothetical protein VFX16_28335 [Pseudonocardiaceae bacterium]|nr:hypothetical protein [Pseudonocardiaceae bacterium]